MKRLFFLVAVAYGLAVILLGCSESLDPAEVHTPPHASPVTYDVAEPCGEVALIPLFAGQYIEVGYVTVSNDESYLCMEINTTGGWVMYETHVAVATSLEDLPMTGSGNPQVGHFELSEDHDPQTAMFEYCINLDEYGYLPGDSLFIAVHAAVELLDADGNTIQEETAWADGLDFPGNSWATYFNYHVRSCDGPEQGIVTVLQPNGAEWICIGSDLLILWETTVEADVVRIELLRNGSPRYTIVESTLNTGFYEWQGVDLFDGVMEGYKIQVTELIEYNSDESDDPFMIYMCGGGE